MSVSISRLDSTTKYFPTLQDLEYDDDDEFLIANTMLMLLKDKKKNESKLLEIKKIIYRASSG